MYKVTGTTTVTGIFGYPVAHSFSPEMHNAAFEALGINYTYLPFPVSPERLGDAVNGIRAMNIRGVNLTIPHKESVIPFLDALSVEAELIGAVNTIVNDGGILTGHNTDGAGFVRSLKESSGRSPEGEDILILGAGGAARAVAVQLALEGAASIQFANRTESKGRVLAELINSNFKTSAGSLSASHVTLLERAGEFGIIINSTPLGMKPSDPAVCPAGLISGETVVYDLIYNPAETLMLKTARRNNAVGVNGLGMLLYQGAAAFELWTGEHPPVNIMKKILSAVK